MKCMNCDKKLSKKELAFGFVICNKCAKDAVKNTKLMKILKKKSVEV